MTTGLVAIFYLILGSLSPPATDATCPTNLLPTVTMEQGAFLEGMISGIHDRGVRDGIAATIGALEDEGQSNSNLSSGLQELAQEKAEFSLPEVSAPEY